MAISFPWDSPGIAPGTARIRRRRRCRWRKLNPTGNHAAAGRFRLPAVRHRRRRRRLGAGWRQHHLTISGPAEAVDAFAVSARSAGVTPWRLDFAMLEEDIFRLAAARPAAAQPHDRGLPYLGPAVPRAGRAPAGTRAIALVGRAGQGCPFDLYTLLPVPDAMLDLGLTHPAALTWLAAHWGVTDRLRQVALLKRPKPGRRLPSGSRVIGYGFFTADETPTAAIATLAARWPALHFRLQPRPLD